MIADFKNQQGLWVKGMMIDGKQVLTASGTKWAGILCRVKPGGYYQKQKPTYIGCQNNFQNFQEFAEWHTSQIGYGCGFHLDKDILVKHNKNYAPDTCVLVPPQINTLLERRQAMRGEYPIGVWYGDSAIRACCNNGEGKTIKLGKFDSVNSAFLAYKKYKESVVKMMAERYKDRIDVRVFDALMVYEVEIND